MNALTIVQRFFPDVTHLRDAKRPITIEVTDRDVAKSKQKRHSECAMAVACKREYDLDGVVISRSMAYLVKNRTATRYKIPMSAQKEVVSFDRGGGFAPGVYSLQKPWHELGSQHTGGSGKKTRTHQVHHMTAGIRTSLQGNGTRRGHGERNGAK